MLTLLVIIACYAAGLLVQHRRNERRGYTEQRPAP